MSVFVETPFADVLMNQLIDAGLTGRRVSDNVVEVTSWDVNESDEDLAFSLGWYADRLGISKMWSEPDDSSSGGVS
ncbi:hypothetical protein [Microbacterium sp.]|uniref:hypothetical protein n=1 Tax=Microbacterium sp. TaxID=51671 RepID=UPI0032420215